MQIDVGSHDNFLYVLLKDHHDQSISKCKSVYVH